jgi:hypothetical protein
VFLPHVELIKKTATLRSSLVARRDASDARFDEDISRQLFSISSSQCSLHSWAVTSSWCRTRS